MTEGGPQQHSPPGQTAAKSVQAEAVAEGLPPRDRRRRRKRRQAAASKQETSFGSGSGLSTNEGLEEEQGESRVLSHPEPGGTGQDEEHARNRVRTPLTDGLDQPGVGLGPNRVATGFKKLES